MIKYLLRRTDLLDKSIPHDNDAVAQRHSFRLVVGDVDERRINAMTQVNNFCAHLVTQLCVKVGKWLIHQKHLRIPNDGASDGNALTLASGESLLVSGPNKSEISRMSSCVLDFLLDNIFLLLL